MPSTLASESKVPTMADTAALDDKTLETKKKKGVMGRIKSKISTTLGRKKGTTDTAPTDKDLKQPAAATAAGHQKSSEPEAVSSGRQDDDAPSSLADSQQQQQQHDDDQCHEFKYPHSNAAQAAIEPFDSKLVDDDDNDNHVDDNINGEGDSNGADSSGDGGSSKEKPPAPAASLQMQQQQQYQHFPEQQDYEQQQQQEDDEEEVFASDYKSGGATAENDYSEDDEDDDDDVEEKLEVFGDDTGNQDASPRLNDELQQQHEPEMIRTGPGALDLVVVGVSSPLRLTHEDVPQMPSPVKRMPVLPAAKNATSPLRSPLSPAKTTSLSSPRPTLDPAADFHAAPASLQQQEPEERKHDGEDVSLQPKQRGGIKVELTQDDDAVADAHEHPVFKPPPQFSTTKSGRDATDAAATTATAIENKKSERAPWRSSSKMHASPQKQLPVAQPLLSDFHFGTELASTATGVIDSPVKRRGGLAVSALSPSAAASAIPARKSFARDQEQHLAMPSPKKKLTTRSMPAKTATATDSARLELPHETLQGVHDESKQPPSPRNAATSRRRASFRLDAPILASSFGASPLADDPASHDTPQQIQQQRSIDENDEDDDDTNVVVSPDAAAAFAFAFDASAAITHELGERVARLLSADPWGDRQDGFDAVQYIVKKADLSAAKNRRELFCASVAAIQRGVDDRVAPVMYCALECLRAVLKEFAPVLDRTFLRYPPTNETLSALIKSLVAKLGDSNKRTQREISQALLRVAKQKKLKTLPHVLLHLSAKDVAPRLQVDTLRQLVSALGVDSKHGLSLGVVMQFAIPALKVADEKTRKAAIELIADLHMLNGAAVNAQLAGVKPEMLRVINRRVDELLAKREKEKEAQAAAAQSANQTDEAAGASGEDDLDKGAELVVVPPEEAKTTVALLDAQLQQAAGVIGPVAWRKLESKTWSDRKEALVDIEKVMTEAKSDLRDARPAFGSVIQLNFLAYCVTVHKCLGDSIAPVVNSAMDCLSTLIKVFGPCVEWREDSVRDIVLLTIMRLFSTMQKPNSRTNRAACRSILKFARLANAHTLRYTLSCIFAKETDALVQMHLLRLLVPEFAFQPDGISAARVLAAVATALAHANDKVRKTAIDVALCTQRLVGKEYVLKHLKDVKPVTLKELEKNFVECDVKKDADRPHSVQNSTSSGANDAGLPPVSFCGSENARRQLNSAPVGVGTLCCTPTQNDDSDALRNQRRTPVLSNDEENFMDSILDGDL